MNIEELIKYRETLIDESRDEDKVLTEEGFLTACMPMLLDAKLVDSEDYSLSRFEDNETGAFVSAFHINESSERLQIFAADYERLFSSNEEDILISRKSDFEKIFKGVEKFVELSIKKHIDPQDSDGSGFLVSKLQSPTYLDQFEVIEIIVLSPSCSISNSGGVTNVKSFSFEDREYSVRFTKPGSTSQIQKELLILKRLVDINLLYQINIAQGNRHPLEVDLIRDFGAPVNALLAADEENFESFLCVLPAEGLANLYKRESSRLLEKNVRSFLQFKGVNKGIRETIKTEPERFIAYNNGLTITATAVEKIEENGVFKIKRLHDFQIVNGGQTTASIFFARKEGLDVSQINLMAKINVAKKISDEDLNELISNISLYSNSQNRVSKVDPNSRNQQLNLLKSLSTSIITPSGNKWFFEKSKGEFNTMLRLAGSARKRKEKEFPMHRRFSKEMLGKYYVAWGEVPHLVKLGGEKVFRIFLEQISGDGDKLKPKTIDRDFYEDTIARIIMFKELENLHGQGPNSLGQLRSAVVPYSMAMLHKFSKARNKTSSFNLQKIWKDEGMNPELRIYMKTLMILINDLIKKYSSSDDYGQYSKKEDLWVKIRECLEIEKFEQDTSTKVILEQYKRSDKITVNRSVELELLNFELLLFSAEIMDHGRKFYLKIKNDIVDQNKNLSKYSNLLIKVMERINTQEVADQLIMESMEYFYRDLIRFSPESIDSLDKLDQDPGYGLALERIISTYNKAVDQNKDVYSEFKTLEKLAEVKGVKFASVFNQIGNKLAKGELPDLKMISLTIPYFTLKYNSGASVNSKVENDEVDIVLVKELLDWDFRKKIFNRGEVSILTGVVYLGKKLTPFTKQQLKPLLSKALKEGFERNN